MEHSLFSAFRQSNAVEDSTEGLLDALVVDDQPSARKIIRKMLFDLDLFKAVEECDDGEAAWSKIKKRSADQYDIVVTDIYMSKLDGIGLITRCRKSSFAKHLPFLAITGETKPETLAFLGEMGIRDCLVKPFSFQLFQDRINAILQRLIDPTEKSYIETVNLIENGSYQEALAKLNRLKDDELSKPRWLNLKGEILLELGELDHARECIENALSSCDYYLTALCSHAKLEYKSGNIAAALESLEKADVISPLMVDRKIDLSDLLFRVKREEDGRKTLCQAASITSDRDTKLQVAEILSEKGYDKDADKIIRKVLSFRDNNVEIYNKIGITLRKRCRYEEAHNAYLTALSYLPCNTAIYYNLGILYLYKWDRPKAYEYFSKALSYDAKFTKAKEMIDCYCGPNAKKHLEPGKSYPSEVYDV